MGREGFVEALVDVVLCKGYNDDEDAEAAEASCRALVCLLAQGTNRDILAEGGNGDDLAELVELFANTESMAVLNTGAMAIGAMVPRERERARAALGLEGRQSPVEAAGGEKVLTRCLQWLYGLAEGGEPPAWLKRGLGLIQMTEEEAADIVKRFDADEGRRNHHNQTVCEVNASPLESVEPDEYFPQSTLFREVTVLPEPEITSKANNMLPT